MASTSPPTGMKVRPATASDLPAIARLHTASFSNIPPLGNTPTPEGRASCAARHAEAWDLHKAQTGLSSGVVCAHEDPSTGVETVVAAAEWFIYPPPSQSEPSAPNSSLPSKPGEEDDDDDGKWREDYYRAPNYLASASWLANDTVRDQIRQTVQPVFEARARWGAGRPGLAILMFMCTDAGFRRRGAATACVLWGLRCCAELGIPAFLHASHDGAAVYERVGFEVVDRVGLDFGAGRRAVLPLMAWWPAGMPQAERRVLGRR